MSDSETSRGAATAAGARMAGAGDEAAARAVEARMAAEAQPREDGAGAETGGMLTRFFRRLTRRTTRTRSAYRDVASTLDVLRAPFIASLLGVIVFAVPEQVHEIYRLFAEDFDFSDGISAANLRFIVFFVMLYFTGYTIWYVARVLTMLEGTAAAEALHAGGARGALARWAPRVLGAAPSIAAGLGMAYAEWSRPQEQDTHGLYGAAAIAVLLGLARLWMSWRRTRHNPQLYVAPKSSVFRYEMRWVFAIVLLGLVAALVWTQPIQLSQTVGTLSIFCFFLIALAFLWSQLTYLYDRYAIPALSILIGSALLWSWLDINDNHFLRTLPRVEAAAAGAAEVSTAEVKSDEELYAGENPTDLKSAFDAWYLSRRDRQAYEDAGIAYPVYVVAAQGGGMYAAYQTAMFLSAIQDVCPNFAQHIFAISGVSGGAIGASVFTGLTLDSAANVPVNPEAPCGVAPDWTRAEGDASFRQRATDVLSQDFLSPLVSAFLFSDFTARFLPYPVPRFDRARALERSIEQAFASAPGPLPDTAARRPTPIAPNPMTTGILSYWRPDGAAPALFLNTMEAETGKRLILSPIADLGPELRSYAKIALRDEWNSPPDVRISTAAVASARFPYVTPAASLATQPSGAADIQTIRKLRLVDGGYFENSGTETALDIMRGTDQTLVSFDRRRALRQRARERNDADQTARLERQDRQEERRARRLQRLAAAGRHNVDFRVIVFDLTDDRFRAPNYALRELTTPIKGILNARESRSPLAQSRARRELESPCKYILFGGGGVFPVSQEDDSTSQTCLLGDVEAGQVWSVPLDDREYDFALGWILSRETLGLIEQQMGAPEECALAAASDPFSDPFAMGPSLGPSLGPDTGSSAGGAGGSDPISSYVPGAQSFDDLTTSIVRRNNGCVAKFIIDQLRREGAFAPSARRTGGAQGDAG